MRLYTIIFINSSKAGEILNIYADKQKLSDLKAKANKLPLSAGVYIMKNKDGDIIYIGKAKALKNRVTQYFGAGNQHTDKVRQMVANVEDFEYIICDSEFEALILENSLIKQNQPKYNILLKDDKGYHYIKISNDRWKKITTSNIADGNGEYIGPYYSSYVVKDTVDEVRRIFKLPDCNRSFDRVSKPCLNYHIGRCDAPCRGNITLDEYLESVESAKSFIKHGENADMIKDLENRMEKASENLDFEYAAKLRDRINAVKKLKERQKVVMCTYKSQDVFASALIGETACVSAFIFRNNMLTDKKHFFVDGVFDRQSMYAEFLQQYYIDKSEIPPRILLDSDFEGRETVEHWLTQKSGRKVSFILPKAGEQKTLVEMCKRNSADNLAQKTQRSGREMSALNELSRLLGLDSVPRYIEAYDISNTAGEENVAGMIVYKDGRPYKNAYKKFKIKTFSGQDDYRSMAEAIDRRLNEYEKGEDEGFSTLPDLILLDGGIGQVSAVVPVIKKHNLNIPLFGMVKDSKHRTRAVADFGGDISIKANRSAYTLITEIQDEVHRFAIGYHRKLRSKKMLNSELTKIDSVGEQRANLLLKHFKTIKAVKSASVDEIAQVKGISRSVAEKIYEYFKL